MRARSCCAAVVPGAVREARVRRRAVPGEVPHDLSALRPGPGTRSSIGRENGREGTKMRRGTALQRGLFSHRRLAETFMMASMTWPWRSRPGEGPGAKGRSRKSSGTPYVLLMVDGGENGVC